MSYMANTIIKYSRIAELKDNKDKLVSMYVKKSSYINIEGADLRIQFNQKSLDHIL